VGLVVLTAGALLVPELASARPGDGYYAKARARCKRKHHSQVSCCLATVRQMKAAGGKRGGCRGNMLRCKGSFAWCESKGSARRPDSRRARKKKRVRLFHSELLIGSSGEARQDAGKVQTDGRTSRDHRFRVKLERGRTRCKTGDPRGNVRRIVASLGGEVVAELKASSSGCWQQTKRYLAPGFEPQGKRLVIQGRGQRGGVVRAWLDAYPRDRPLAGPSGGAASGGASGGGGSKPGPAPLPADQAELAGARKALVGTWLPDIEGSLAAADAKHRDELKILLTIYVDSSFAFSADGTLVTRGKSMSFSGRIDEGGSEGSLVRTPKTIKGRWSIPGARGQDFNLTMAGEDGKDFTLRVTRVGKDRAYVHVGPSRFYFNRK